MSTLTSHEEAIAGTKVPRPSARSFLPALSRRARLLLHGQSSDEAHPLDGVMQSIIAPFVVAYVDWVLEQAAINEVKRLYFVARDGEILLRIAEVLIGTRSAPDCVTCMDRAAHGFLPLLQWKLADGSVFL